MNEDLGLAAETEGDRLDPSSFAILYEKHRLPVYRYLRARTPSDADALDLAADTFERAFASLGRFRRRDGGVQAWLFRIARNTAIDAHRRRRPTVGLAGAHGHLGRVAVEADRLEHERTEILDLVARLPGDQQEALLLRYAGGLTAREIGFVMGKREGAVQKQIERGLAALREAF
ncbi:MAG: RNA polymerase sigma factor [Chloroflexi bacterium]|nr:RNA polymerase sigma factor [Chloroflexota bacterium]